MNCHCLKAAIFGGQLEKVLWNLNGESDNGERIAGDGQLRDKSEASLRKIFSAFSNR